VSQGNSVTVDVSSGSKCHSGRNVGGRNVKAPSLPREIIADPHLWSRALIGEVNRRKVMFFVLSTSTRCTVTSCTSPLSLLPKAQEYFKHLKTSSIRVFQILMLHLIINNL
jgi:hypothetical protein